MTALDFFNSLAFNSLINLGIGFFVFGIAVNLAARAVGIKGTYTQSFSVALVVSLFSLMQNIFFLGAFFLSIILGAVALVSISRVYSLDSMRSLYILVIAVIIYIVVQTVLMPLIISAL